MPLTKEDAQTLRNLERETDELLDQISTATGHISQESLHRLDACAGAAARIAFGTDNAGLLSEQMTTLIAWTDHLDEPPWVKNFEQALKCRPLASPWKK